MQPEKFRIAILASGNGSNAEAIIKHFKDHAFIEVGLVLSNKPTAFVLERAEKLGIKTKIFTRGQFLETREVLRWLLENNITHIVLAGFLWLIPDYLIKVYTDKIINIHPALLPKFGGKGMYGMKVHEAVKVSLEHETGITIHLVNEKYDDGKILFQGKCNVEDHYTPEKIAACVQGLEYKHYPKVIEQWILGEL